MGFATDESRTSCISTFLITNTVTFALRVGLVTLARAVNIKGLAPVFYGLACGRGFRGFRGYPQAEHSPQFGNGFAG